MCVHDGISPLINLDNAVLYWKLRGLISWLKFPNISLCNVSPFTIFYSSTYTIDWTFIIKFHVRNYIFPRKFVVHKSTFSFALNNNIVLRFSDSLF